MAFSRQRLLNGALSGLAAFEQRVRDVMRSGPEIQNSPEVLARPCAAWQSMA